MRAAGPRAVESTSFLNEAMSGGKWSERNGGRVPGSTAIPSRYDISGEGVHNARARRDTEVCRGEFIPSQTNIFQEGYGMM